MVGAVWTVREGALAASAAGATSNSVTATAMAAEIDAAAWTVMAAHSLIRLPRARRHAPPRLIRGLTSPTYRNPTRAIDADIKAHHTVSERAQEHARYRAMGALQAESKSE